MSRNLQIQPFFYLFLKLYFQKCFKTSGKNLKQIFNITKPIKILIILLSTLELKGIKKNFGFYSQRRKRKMVKIIL